MNEALRVALVGDPNDERFDWFKEFLADVYAIGAVRARTFEDVKRFAREESGKLSARVIFLTDDLPLSDGPSGGKRAPYINFLKLEEIEQFYDADFVCIVTRAEDPENLEGLAKRPYLIDLRVFPPGDDDKPRLRLQLRSLGRRLPAAVEISSIAEITEWDKSSRTLRRQIRSLSDRHDIADGEKHLLRLIRNCLDSSDAEKIEIKQLGQGKSGAGVFRLVMSRPDERKEYVLKLCDAQSLWKLESEVRGHLASQKVSQSDYESHVAVLRKPSFPFKPTQLEGEFIVNSGQWYGIHYDFLGDPALGKFIDLETALTATPPVLVEKTEGTDFAPASTDTSDLLALRLKILGSTLDGLYDIWYGKGELGSRRVATAWDIEDAPDREFIPLPPYRLTRRVKGWVQDFLDSREALIGARLFPNWDTHQACVLRLVSDDSTPEELAELGTSVPFTLSPVHGDLNANNVLLWLKRNKYPFVIDLPFYQKDGHALQDFARLEVEIKYALLDRQEESPAEELAAFDYSATQVPLWIEMEERLLEESALDASALNGPALNDDTWRAEGLKKNISLCYKLIILTRVKACLAQQKPLAGWPAPGPFATEYLPALLYHTIRAIAYPSLSIFKRLLAVYSSGRILKRLK
jgi:Ternary complex associated domain 9